MAIIDFNTTKCRHCYKCVRNCEVKAIMVKDGRAEIMSEHCILCGKCLQICPQSAKTLNSDLAMVKGFLKRGEKVVVSIAPSYQGLLEFQTTGQVRSALKKLGFYDVLETAQGAAMVTYEYTKLLQEHKMKNIITTCCPSVNELIEKYFPEIIGFLTPIPSPMIAHGRLIKKELGSDIKVIFLGPCIAKKREANDERDRGAIDGVLNFEEVKQWLQEEMIAIENCEDEPFDRNRSMVNQLYPVTNGIVNSVLATRNQKDAYRKFYVHGEKNCIDLCKSMIRGEIENCFIEMNMCSGGCIKGPTVQDEAISRFKVKLDMEEEIEKIPVESCVVEKMLENIQMKKTFYLRSPKDPIPTEAEIVEILTKTGKYGKENELNCGACGYQSCREKAVAVFQKKAELNMCIPFMYEKSESLSNLVLETSPNMVLIVDRDLKIIEYSAAGIKYFGKTRMQALDMYLYELIDPTDVEWVLKNHQSIHGKKVRYPEYGISTLQNIVYIEKEDAVLATLIDISREEEQAREDYDKKLETIELAQKVIHKQMMVAQEIAGLLGETTAETKTTLTKLCRSLLEDSNEGGG